MVKGFIPTGWGPTGRSPWTAGVGITGRATAANHHGTDFGGAVAPPPTVARQAPPFFSGANSCLPPPPCTALGKFWESRQRGPPGPVSRGMAPAQTLGAGGRGASTRSNSHPLMTAQKHPPTSSRRGPLF